MAAACLLHAFAPIRAPLYVAGIGAIPSLSAPPQYFFRAETNQGYGPNTNHSRNSTSISIKPYTKLEGNIAFAREDIQNTHRCAPKLLIYRYRKQEQS